jgi:hypothetical protein
MQTELLNTVLHLTNTAVLLAVTFTWRASPSCSYSDSSRWLTTMIQRAPVPDNTTLGTHFPRRLREVDQMNDQEGGRTRQSPFHLCNYSQNFSLYTEWAKSCLTKMHLTLKYFCQAPYGPRCIYKLPHESGFRPYRSKEPHDSEGQSPLQGVPTSTKLVPDTKCCVHFLFFLIIRITSCPTVGSWPYYLLSLQQHTANCNKQDSARLGVENEQTMKYKFWLCHPTPEALRRCKVHREAPDRRMAIQNKI